MNSKEAIQNYLFAERAKTNLITLSQSASVLYELKGAEKSGAKKMLKIFAGAIGQDLGLAYNTTKNQSFKDANEILEQAEGMLENEDLEDASLAISSAITKATTPAQQAWQVLSKNELI
ncbi:hypothetical protein L1994_07040 [Methanomicrobium antiquum]|uniref:Uncharacterized protein n=1 Tax=Methanomicrobium antiquum TaxID=487686 RepID=A0AAF0FJW1_9EURY|nr:hypothetical protein [Methanomicrobium antiquum]MDD3977531.1 hypothetical protein [Methanomicrobium sp.]WFN35913.1 hypothetical protein L1994_07040 [Methanomicrobium antiquum]